jgi:hypothetical protein
MTETSFSEASPARSAQMLTARLDRLPMTRTI